MLFHYDWVNQLSNSTSWCCRYTLTASNRIYVGSKASFGQWQSAHTNIFLYTDCTTNVSVIYSPCWQNVTTTVTPTCYYNWPVTHSFQCRHKSGDFHMYPGHRDMSVRSVSLCVTVCVVCRVYGPVGRVWPLPLLWHTRPVYEWTLVTVQWATSSCICTTACALTPNHLAPYPTPTPPLPRGLNSKTLQLPAWLSIITNPCTIVFSLIVLSMHCHSGILLLLSFVVLCAPTHPPPTHTLNGNCLLNINKRHTPVVNNIHEQLPHPSEIDCFFKGSSVWHVYL